MPSPAICTCAKPRFRIDEEVEVCFYCGKRRGSDAASSTKQAPGGSKQTWNASRPADQVTFKPHLDPVLVAEAVAKIRSLLNVEATFGIPESLTDRFFPTEATQVVAAKAEALAADGQVDAGRILFEEWINERYLRAFQDAARLPFSVFASSAPYIEQFMSSWKLDYSDLYQAIGQAIALRLLADRLRRDFGIAPDWPAELAILCGTIAVPPPFVASPNPRPPKRSLAQQMGEPLLGKVALPLDDPRSIQGTRDMAHAVFEANIKKLRPFFRRTQSYVSNDDGELVPADDAELAIYKLFQKELPELFRQPLPDTATPRRVMIQRFADAKERRRFKIDTPLGSISRRRRHKRKPTKDEISGS